MNKEAFDLICQKVSNERLGAGQMLSTLDAAKKHIVDNMGLTPEHLKAYGVGDNADKLISRIYDRVNKGPAIGDYSQLNVSRSVPAWASGYGAVGGGLGAGLSALLGKRFAPFKTMRNIGRMALGGSGVGTAFGTHSTMSNNRQMNNVKNMLGSEYGIRTNQELRSLAPVLLPKAREQFLSQFEPQR